MFNDHYEEFTESQSKVLGKYVTNVSGSVFALKNLPEVIKGALFSRYSRSNLGLRSLLLKEFIDNNDEAHFDMIAGSPAEEKAEDQVQAIQKAQNFYDRILDGYGDDSIGELGGAHMAVENISMLAAKFIEDARIGGSPLEKSTRYIYFDQKVQGEYLYYREPILMTSAYRELYLDTCNHLFETYSELIPPLTKYFEEKFPKDPNSSKAAYTASVRAKTLDCLRGLLPAGTLTNMGIFGNGRFYEQLLHKLETAPLAEMQDVGKRAYEELSKVIPSFVRRANHSHRTHQSYAQFYDNMNTELRVLQTQFAKSFTEESNQKAVRLLTYDPNAVQKVTAALLFQNSSVSFASLMAQVEEMTDEDIVRVLDVASANRENRRHKSPRALEHAFYTFEIVSDFGAYRDMHRHRMLTQERQLLSCDLGYYIPEEILETELEEKYRAALVKAKTAYDLIAQELPEEAQYIVPMAFNVRWYFHVNLRALQWMCELRSQAAGHPTYRYLAQAMAKQVSEAHPAFERFFKFVDYEGYDLGRLGQEERKLQKMGKGA